jgi:hypothetical protein
MFSLIMRWFDFFLVFAVTLTRLNRGLMNPPMDATTADGYDLLFGTNVLGIVFSPLFLQ